MEHRGVARGDGAAQTMRLVGVGVGVGVRVRVRIRVRVGVGVRVRVRVKVRATKSPMRAIARSVPAERRGRSAAALSARGVLGGAPAERPSQG